LFVVLGGCEEETAPPPPAPDEEPAAPLADIARVRGDVRWQAAGHGSWVEAHVEQTLHESDSVQTMTSAEALIRFREGDATVRLEAETTLQVERQVEQAARLQHLSGRLVARLDPDTETRRLEVSLPPGDLILEARDVDDQTPMEARVDVEGEHTDISMIQGRGRVERNAGSTIDIEEARYVQLGPDGEVLEEGVESEPVEVLEPAADATVRTRTETTFRWDSGDASELVLQILPESGEPTVVRTTAELASVELPSGSYTWSVRAMTADGLGRASEPRSVVVDLDRSPPALAVSNPAPNASHRGTTLVVSGRSEVGAEVEVNGRSAIVAADGSFRVTVPVRPGLTNLVLSARDDLGNSRVVSRPVLVE